MAALRGPVLAVMPAVAAFERQLGELGGEERADLVARADALLAHRFDLLGSGEVELGPEIDWHRDFKSGLPWPRLHHLLVRTRVLGDADLMVPRQLSRFQHLPLLAGATRITRDSRYLEEIGRQLEHWIAVNPVEFGINWAYTMDVAIRATNWTAALALCAEQAEGAPWLERAVESLLLHGRFMRAHPQRSIARNNKYVADIVGILPVAALFSGGREGRAWLRWSAREIVCEMDFQVFADGCAFEASTSYHQLDCELFSFGLQALDALGRPVPDRCRQSLERMLDFVADYTRPDGLAPQIGDTADSRLLPLGDYGRADPRSHLHLFGIAGREYRPSRAHAAYPDGGYYVMRGGELYAIVRCGEVGSDGWGWHAHNDQLAFELALGDQPLVIDPGSYTYTTDPAARNQFRSTASHSTLQVAGAEQNEIHADNLFLMRDRSRAEALRFEPAGGRATFEGRHHGFEALSPPATHTRRLEFDGPGARLAIEDTVSGSGAHPLQWTFPLAPCSAEAQQGRALAEFDGARLTFEGEGLEFSVEPGWYSPSYGVRFPVPFIRARRLGRPGNDVTRLVLTAERR